MITIKPPSCPSCENRGNKVNRITLESLLISSAALRISESQYRFCDSLDCDVVYFAEDGSTFLKSDLTVRVGVKERETPRHVCYCFDHTIEEINDKVARTGESTVLDDIKARMADACWCETKSPMGSCCLGTVNKYVKLAIAGQTQDELADSEEEEFADCCSMHDTHDELEPSGQSRRRAGTLATGGSVLTAMLSSACCWLPLGLLAFGVSAAGVSSFFERWRPHFAVSAIVLLGLGFYFAYFRASSCKADCYSPKARRQLRLNRAMLWTSSAVVLAFVLFPKYVGVLMKSVSGQPTSIAVAADGSVERESSLFAFDIEGMSCEACTVTLKSELSKVPGVESVSVDYDSKRAKITAADDTIVPGVLDATTRVGYSASLLKDADTLPAGGG